MRSDNRPRVSTLTLFSFFWWLTTLQAQLAAVQVEAGAHLECCTKRCGKHPCVGGANRRRVSLTAAVAVYVRADYWTDSTTHGSNAHAAPATPPAADHLLHCARLNQPRHQHIVTAFTLGKHPSTPS